MLHHSVSLYFAAVFIWGSTFFAIKFQLGEVAEELSVAYRFALAALMLIGWCRARRLPMRFTPAQHGWMVLQGLFLFCLNYVNGAIIFRQPVSLKVTVGALIGLAGIALVFWPELVNFDANPRALSAFGFAVLGTYIASLGNTISARNQRAQIPVVQSNAYGMAYAAIVLLLYAAVRGVEFELPLTFAYTSSLIYLSLFGSVLAFGSYLTLLGRIGSARAGYAMVLFPLVALAISTLFEGYVWTPLAATGVVLVLAGNLLVMVPRAVLMRWLQSAA
jgi:drug/metabolite transporter (DMT)-like permease